MKPLERIIDYQHRITSYDLYQDRDFDAKKKWIYVSNNKNNARNSM